MTQNNNDEPTKEELELLSALGRFDRYVIAGMTPDEALDKVLEVESADEYARRNREAMETVEKYTLSDEYSAKLAAALALQDPQKKAAALADLKRETYASLDMEAVHRTINARNRQWKAEGVLGPRTPKSPDAPSE